MSPSRSGRRIDPHDWPGDSAYGRVGTGDGPRRLVLAFAGLLGLGILAEERRQTCRGTRASPGTGSSKSLTSSACTRAIINRAGRKQCCRGIESMPRKPDEKWAIQAQAVAALSGLDVSLEKELRIYAQSLTYAANGTLWLGRPGGGVDRWNPETDRLETWPLDGDGPAGDPTRRHTVAARADLQRAGPRRPESPRPPPGPGFPVRLLDVQRQAVVRSSARSEREGIAASGLDPRPQGLARGGGPWHIRWDSARRLGRRHGESASSDRHPEPSGVARVAASRCGLRTGREPARSLGRIGMGRSLEHASMESRSRASGRRTPCIASPSA